MYSKNEIKIYIDELLDLNNYFDKDLCNNNSEYHLYIVLGHEGFIDFGHYISYIKNMSTQNWLEFDDAEVKELGN